MVDIENISQLCQGVDIRQFPAKFVAATTKEKENWSAHCSVHTLVYVSCRRWGGGGGGQCPLVLNIHFDAVYEYVCLDACVLFCISVMQYPINKELYASMCVSVCLLPVAHTGCGSHWPWLTLAVAHTGCGSHWLWLILAMAQTDSNKCDTL